MALETDLAIRRHLRLAVGGALVFGGISGAWATLVPLDSSVIAPGLVAVENNSKKVQHQLGGVVRRIVVVEGQRVAEGEIIVKLDETLSRASLAIVDNEMTSLKTRQDRLIAERDDARTIAFQPSLLVLALTSADVREKIESERNQFERRLDGRNGLRAQLRERIGQVRQEISGLETQLKANTATMKVATEELVRLEPLKQKGLIQLPRLTALEREIARNDGTIGEIRGRIASARGRITETETQVEQIDRELKSEVVKELREVETKLQELAQKRTTAEDQMQRTDVRATASGTVHQLAIHTVGGVVAPNDTMMLIVPDEQPLIIEARVTPAEIDQINPQQPARVRFSAFNQRTTPELNGEVFRISRDVVRDPQTNQLYFAIGIRVPDTELKRLQGLKLQAGMPADSFIKTGARTFGSYLAKPIMDVVPRVFTER